MPHAQVNGIDLYYEETGRGDLLVLINGLGGNALAWAPLLLALAGRARARGTPHAAARARGTRKVAVPQGGRLAMTGGRVR